MTISRPTNIMICILILAGTIGCTNNNDSETEVGVIPFIRIGTVTPKHSTEITSSPFGIQAGTLVDSLVSRAAEIGVKWTRLGISWPSVEKEKGIYSWEETDKVDELKQELG